MVALKNSGCSTIIAAGLLMIAAGGAQAATIDWSSWGTPATGNATSSPGSVTGVISAGLTVSYSGEVEGLYAPSWSPTTTFAGGTVANGPTAAVSYGIDLFGGTYGLTDTITFSQAVVDPVMAIWSLGGFGDSFGGNLPPAEFLFNAAEPFVAEAGGPSAEYGGSALYIGGRCPTYAVCGIESNGTIQFQGTFSSLTWTTPNYEDFYAFTVGGPESGGGVPEPMTWALMIGGFGLAGAALRRRRAVGSA